MKLTNRYQHTLILRSSMLTKLNGLEVKCLKLLKTLKDLKPGQFGIVTELKSKGPIKRRLIDMGVTPGAKVYVRKVAPFGDPIEINIRGYELSLRKEEASHIIVQSCSSEEGK
ncbi:MAG: ferrous iron transport protein A [Clostridiales bacterium]|nr:ferrous iron transport protein A [Clostridiales bacterium]